jgi:hypothetical protein
MPPWRVGTNPAKRIPIDLSPDELSRSIQPSTLSANQCQSDNAGLGNANCDLHGGLPDISDSYRTGFTMVLGQCDRQKSVAQGMPGGFCCIGRQSNHHSAVATPTAVHDRSRTRLYSTCRRPILPKRPCHHFRRRGFDGSVAIALTGPTKPRCSLNIRKPGCRTDPLQTWVGQWGSAAAPSSPCAWSLCRR